MELICIKCPRGCNLVVEGESVTGNLCPRGLDYAKEELTCPMRIVTALIKVGDSLIAPVKTTTEVPKDKIFEVLNILKDVHLDSAKIGDIVVSNILNLGVDIVVTGNPYVS